MTFAYAVDEPLGLSDADARALLGGKAANLGVMSRDLGLPVPPAFVITTETCRRFLADGWPDGLDDELRERMRGLEVLLGRRFGDPADPLLVSVRSGAPVSMPGMMDTILDLGLNDDDDRRPRPRHRRRGLRPLVPRALRRELPLDRRRRGGAVRPVGPAATARSRPSSARGRAIAPGRIAGRRASPTTSAPPSRSRRWSSATAGPTPATGVLFTRDPATGEPALYGDVLFDAQGEDVVAGTHRTEPIAVLDDRLPEVAAELRAAAARLERHFSDLCDIEFTIESGRLWLLQVRVGKRSPAAALRIAVDMAEDASFPLTRGEAVERVRPLLADPPTTTSARSGFVRPLLTGLPASPGMASGPIATTPRPPRRPRPAARRRSSSAPRPRPTMSTAWRRRPASSPRGAGSRATPRSSPAAGGSRQSSERPASTVSDDRVAIGDRELVPGDVITIDGRTGEVFEGVIPGTTEVVPEVRTLLGWAAELGIEIAPAAGSPDAPEPAGSEWRRRLRPRPHADRGPVPAGHRDQGIRPAAARSPRRSSPYRPMSSRSSTGWRPMGSSRARPAPSS